MTRFRQSVYNPAVTIQVRFFAIIKQRLDLAVTVLDLPDNATVAVAQAKLIDQFPNIADLMPRTAVAINREYVKPTEPLQDGDELALIPPVSGG